MVILICLPSSRNRCYCDAFSSFFCIGLFQSFLFNMHFIDRHTLFICRLFEERCALNKKYMLQFHSKNKYSLVWLVLFIFFFFLDSYRKLKNVPNGLNLESFALSCWPLWVLSAAHHKLPSFTVLASKFCFYLRSAFRVWNEYSPVLNICIMWLWLM